VCETNLKINHSLILGDQPLMAGRFSNAQKLKGGDANEQKEIANRNESRR
jgi:hypothetical protein